MTKNQKKKNHPNLLKNKNHIQKKKSLLAKKKRKEEEEEEENNKKHCYATLQKKFKKKNGQRTTWTKHTLGHFGQINKSNSPTIFSSFWEENFLVGPGRKHLGPTFFFLSPPQPNTFQNFFPPHFFPSSLKFSLPNTPLVPQQFKNLYWTVVQVLH